MEGQSIGREECGHDRDSELALVYSLSRDMKEGERSQFTNV